MRNKARVVAKLAIPCFQAALALAAAQAGAVTIIPDKDGFSGFVNLGAGAIGVESNLLATLAKGVVDIGDPVISDLSSSPASDAAAIPILNFELSYTLAKTRTQFYLGNLLEDFLTFDLTGLAGVRQGVGGVGIFGLAAVTTSLSAEVWEDPYQTGVKRQETERSGNGYRVSWEQIFGSGFAVDYSSKGIDIDNERSGEALGLSAAERRLLNRNSDLNTLRLGYEFRLAEGRHVLTPALTYRENDSDGGAMASDGYGASLNYIFTQNASQRWVFNLHYTEGDFDRVNPVFDEKDSGDRYGASVTYFHSAPFGWKPWVLNVTGGYFEDDHDIDFYDSTVSAFTVGMFRRF